MTNRTYNSGNRTYDSGNRTYDSFLRAVKEYVLLYRENVTVTAALPAKEKRAFNSTIDRLNHSWKDHASQEYSAFNSTIDRLNHSATTAFSKATWLSILP